MATDVPKKLKKGKPQAANPRPEVSPGGNNASSNLLIKFFWIPPLIGVAAYLYLNPSFVVSFVEEWIGFSEHYDAAPVAYQPKFTHLLADIERRDAVLKAFKHSWHAYERNAMGDDEYHPITQQGSNLTSAGGIGYMVVDALDSLQIMGLESEYTRARKWVAEKLSFDRDDLYSTFEITIRVLGGLLSAYHLSGQDPVYLEKATDLADRIMPVFDTPLGIPMPVVNLHDRTGHHTKDFPGKTSIAEATTLQLEFRYLSELTGNESYWVAVEKVMSVVNDAKLPHGLASVFILINEGKYDVSTIRLGSRGDSYYEYLLKQYLQTSNTQTVYSDMYSHAMDGVHQHLLQTSMGTQMIYTSELVPENDENGEMIWRLTPKQDHLACFLGGSLMLGATRVGARTRNQVSTPPRPDELSEKGKRDWQTGVELVKTCMHTHDTATGLSPEIVYFRVPSDGVDSFPGAPTDWYIKGAAGGYPPYDAHYLLRPETIESLFIAYRLTGDDLYRDHAWRIFQAIEKHCRVDGGYAAVVNVDQNPARLQDTMETFFLSETLKYLYLIFESSDVLPLNQYVFNTEAHPLPIFKPSIRTAFS